VADEAPEIIPRPPSSPIGATLLITTTIGLIVAIGIVWSELFTEYLPAASIAQPAEMSKHNPKTEADNHARDHYSEDYPESSTDVTILVEKDLGLSAKIGDMSQAGGGGAGPGPETSTGGQ